MEICSIHHSPGTSVSQGMCDGSACAGRQNIQLMVFPWERLRNPKEAPGQGPGIAAFYLFEEKKRNIVPALVAGPPQWKTDAL